MKRKVAPMVKFQDGMHRQLNWSSPSFYDPGYTMTRADIKAFLEGRSYTELDRLRELQEKSCVKYHFGG